MVDETKPKNRGGRPTKWSKALQARALRLIREGDRPEVAFGVQGIDRATYFRWRDGSGGAPDGFATAVARALDDFESKARGIILEGDKGNGGFGPAKAHLEILSRRMPRIYAQQVRHHVEQVEREFMSALREACADDGLRARVRETEDLSLVVGAVCEILARRDSEGDALRAPGGAAPQTGGAQGSRAASGIH